MDLLALDSRRGAKTSAPSARTGQHARVNVCVRARALRPAADPALADGALCSHTNRSPRAGLPRSTIFSASNCLICIRSRFITVLPGNRTVSLVPLHLSRFHFLPFPLRSPPLSILAQYRRPSTLLMRFRAGGTGTYIVVSCAREEMREIGDLERRLFVISR